MSYLNYWELFWSAFCFINNEDILRIIRPLRLFKSFETGRATLNPIVPVLGKLKKMVNFTYFCSKTTHVNGCIILFISKNDTVIMYIYMVTVIFYFIIK